MCIRDRVKDALKTGNFAPVIAAYREKLAYHNGGMNSWRRNDEADIMEKGVGTRVPSIQFAGGQGGGLPKQIPSRHNRLSDVSMDVVQSKRRRPRKKVTVIVNNQGDTLISAQKVSMLGTLNSTNKPQLVKRGI